MANELKNEFGSIAFFGGGTGLLTEGAGGLGLVEDEEDDDDDDEGLEDDDFGGASEHHKPQTRMNEMKHNSSKTSRTVGWRFKIYNIFVVVNLLLLRFLKDKRMAHKRCHTDKKHTRCRSKTHCFLFFLLWRFFVLYKQRIEQASRRGLTNHGST